MTSRAPDPGATTPSDQYRPQVTSDGPYESSQARPAFTGRWRGYDRHHVDSYVEHQHRLVDALRQRALRAEARLGAILTAGEHQSLFAEEVDLAERRTRIEPWQEAEEIVTRLEVDLAERRTRIEPLGPGADPPAREPNNRMGDELATDHGLIPVDPSEAKPTEPPGRRVTRRPPRWRSTATGIAAAVAVLAAALVWLGLGASGRSVARPLLVVPTPVRAAHVVRLSHRASAAPALILESAVGKHCWVRVRRGGRHRRGRLPGNVGAWCTLGDTDHPALVDLRRVGAESARCPRRAGHVALGGDRRIRR